MTRARSWLPAVGRHRGGPRLHDEGRSSGALIPPVGESVLEIGRAGCEVAGEIGSVAVRVGETQGGGKVLARGVERTETAGTEGREQVMLGVATGLEILLEHEEVRQ
jgi:hypothetical protein